MASLPSTCATPTSSSPAASRGSTRGCCAGCARASSRRRPTSTCTAATRPPRAAWSRSSSSRRTRAACAACASCTAAAAARPTASRCCVPACRAGSRAAPRAGSSWPTPARRPPTAAPAPPTCSCAGGGRYDPAVSSSFGHLFRIHTWGESHGGAVGVVIDGCPPRIPLSAEDLQVELDRRRPGQSRLTTPRQEADRAEILSGVFEGQTLGTPILVLVRNEDARPEAYAELRDVYRPSHADFTYEAKYGIRNWQGGGRASARETIGRVAAGAIARKVLSRFGVGEIVGFVSQVH